MLNRVRYTARGGTPYIKTSAVVMGQDQIDVFRAMCAVEGRRPHQLAADILLAAIRRARKDLVIRQVAGSISAARGAEPKGRHLRLVQPGEAGEQA